MAEVMHFKTQKERLDYLRGSYEEIVPSEVVIPESSKNAPDTATKPSEGTRKTKKGKKKDDAVQTE